METKELISIMMEPFRNRTEHILALLNGENGIREAVAATALEFFCHSCHEWKEVTHVKCPGRTRP